MSTFTSTLPDDLLLQLSEEAKNLSIPKNKLIERALRLYLDHLNRAQYLKSYKEMNEDENVLDLAEEGLQAYLTELEK